jgi:hypothetical protein
MHVPTRFAASLALALACVPFVSHASLVESRNVVQLIDEASTIVVGSVISVSDGFDVRGLPYTEVKLEIQESLSGPKAEALTFRQFGLQTPRPTADGKRQWLMKPDGWPTWRLGDHALVFLAPPAGETGFRTTAGLEQGKVAIRNGVMHQHAHLFAGVEATPGTLTARESRIASGMPGPVAADALVGLVRRAVAQRWVESGRLRHAP